MHVKIIAHWEARLHGVEVVPGLDLCCGQSHRRATTKAVEGDLLGARLDVMQVIDELGTLGVDSRHSRVHCQLEIIQPHCQGW